jgi:hypothetical protein
MNAISYLVVTMAAITSLSLSVWVFLDRKSRPYAVPALIWAFLVAIMFAYSNMLARGGFTSEEMVVVSNLIPGIVLCSVLVLFVMSVTEIVEHLKVRRKKK